MAAGKEKKKMRKKGSCALHAGTQGDGEDAAALSGRQVGQSYQGASEGRLVLSRNPDSHEGQCEPPKFERGGPLCPKNQEGDRPPGPENGECCLGLQKGA